MIWLCLSIIASSAIFVLFRLFPRMGVQTFPAIVVNYFVAAVSGLLMLEPGYELSSQLNEPWFIGGLGLGVLFITLFYLMAFTAQRTGVGVTSIATKMSLVLPVAWFMATDPADAPDAIKVGAVVLAIIGVLLSASRSSEGEFKWSYALFPVIIFLGSGVIDLVIGTFSNEAYFSSDNDRYLFTAAPFITSTFIGAAALGYRVYRRMPGIDARTLIGGTVLGVINFGSIYFLVRTFEAHLLDRSAIIPVNNLGVVLCSAFASMLLFKEVFTKRKRLGLLLSILAIALLLYAGR
jgi:hypothetical protein